MVLTGYLVLSPATGLIATVIGISADLTPASGRQDHTTSPSALATYVRAAAASTASYPASVTIAIRPSFGIGYAKG
jgi:hypothetical protein